jgi:hypothetical protein
MRTHALIAAVCLAALASPALAQTRCVSVPDTSDSRYVENGKQEMLCHHGVITDKVNEMEMKAQIDSLAGSIRQFELQRRFDALPKQPSFVTIP